MVRFDVLHEKVRGMDWWIAVAAIASVMLLLFAAAQSQAQTYQVIHNFSDGIGGNSPWSEITIGPGGHMYGTTLFGGDNHNFYCYYGCGIVYEIYQKNGSWIFTTLHEFLLPEGANPHSGVVIGPDGALYGAASEGGMQLSGCDLAGCGTVYKLQPPATPPPSPLTFWNLTDLYEFTGGDNDGASSSGVVVDQAGNLYGADGGGPDNCGLVYQLSRNGDYWTFTNIYSGFYCPDGNEGIEPGWLLVDSEGNLYGTTEAGGHPSCPYGPDGCGTVFKLTHTDAGWVGTTLYEFNASTDGAVPDGLVMDRAGNLFGGALEGGPNGGGTVWELSPSGGGWSFQVLHSFTSTQNISGVVGRLALGPDGSLYGCTMSEGLYGYGNVFKLTPSNGGWGYTSLYDFDGYTYGAFPERGPTLDSNNNLFGTTYYGGPVSAGVIWEITQ